MASGPPTGDGETVRSLTGIPGRFVSNSVGLPKFPPDSAIRFPLNALPASLIAG